MRLLRPLLLSALALGASGGVSVSFEAPILVARAGQYADGAYVLGYGGGVPQLTRVPLMVQVSPPPAAGAPYCLFSADDLSFPPVGAGAGPCAAAGGFTGAPVPLAGGALATLGVVAVPAPGANRTAFSSPGATSMSASAGGPACAAAAGATFTGLPRPAACAGGDRVYGCPFRLAGGDVLRLRDGTLLYSAIVRWAGGGSNATSVVCFASGDGRAWTYISTIADAAALPDSGEGPNENALSLLSDGATVLAVMWLDAGDGRAGGYANYASATSGDGGMTWSAAAPLPTAGCARPRLAHLGADGAGGVAQRAPLLLAGGRHKNANTSDVLLWVDEAGDGRAFGAGISLSAAHNAGATDASWRFTPEVNSSAHDAPRQTTAYTSLVALDGGPVAGQTSRRMAVFYNRHLAAGSDMLFVMPFTVAWA